MAKRVKKIIITGVTREAADEAFAKYAKADAESAKITADIELQCAKIREKYAGRLAELDAAKTVAFDTLQSFATENQSELFSKKKSLDMAHGVIGFRTGTPKLKTLKGFTWASALQLVKEFLPGYVRTTEEVAKDKLLADRDMEVKVKDGEDKVELSHEMARCASRWFRTRPSTLNRRRRRRHEAQGGTARESGTVPPVQRHGHSVGQGQARPLIASRVSPV